MGRYKKLTLLHSNDMHGDFLTEKIDDKLVGGVSMLSGYVDKVRKEEPNTLYCIAGDMFRGSVIDSEYQGLSTIEIMNALAPDVVTLGNHETDYGVAHLLFLEKCAKFPIINANLFIRTNQARLFKPHLIIEVDGMKILFIGILTEEVLSQTKHDGLIGSFVGINEAAAEVGRICNTYNATDIDFTVLLTHIGFEEDKQLAAKLDPAWGVDVIIGGHSHTFLTEPAKVNDILIVQAGTGTDQIGRFDILVDTYKNCVSEYTWEAVPINDKHCPRDPEIDKLISTYKENTDVKYNRMVTRFRRELTHPDRNRETELGGLFSDILKESLNLDIMLLGSGSVRNEHLGPLVLFSDLAECFPYDDSVTMVTVTGEQLRRMMLYMLRDEVWQGAHSEFYQLSKGMKVVYDRQKRELVEFNFEEEPIRDEKFYTVGLQEFHYLNIEENLNVTQEEILANRKPRVVSTSCREVLDEYLSVHQHLDHVIEGRLTLL